MSSSRYFVTLAVLVTVLLSVSLKPAVSNDSSGKSDDSGTGVITSIPRTMSYQSILKDSDGDPVIDSVYSVTFRIFNSESGGSSLWDESLPCTTSAGFFSTLFSNVNLPFDEDYWLELEIGGEILDPRQRMNMVGYAARADTADYALVSPGGSNGWVDDGTTVKLESDMDSVGIGTATPSEKLEVNGNIKASGTMSSGNSITIDGVNDRITASSGTIDFDNENLLTTGKATIGPGHSNAGVYAFIAGQNNTTSANYTAVGGGYGNMAISDASTVSGGFSNTANGFYSTVGGGALNVASGQHSTIAGGNVILASGNYSAVGGGAFDTTSGICSYIGGGVYNIVGGNYSTIGGGFENYVAGSYSAILGGRRDSIFSGADYSYLFGINSNLTQDSTFMVDMPHIRFGDETGGYEFPGSDGTSDQVMTTDGNGQLSWADIPGGGGWSDDGAVVRLETSSDSVGIGTSTPSEKLDVNGNIRASGTITSGNSIYIDGVNSKITSSVGTVDFDDDNLATSGLATLGPGGVLFNTIGSPALPLAAFNPTEGVTFTDSTAGDTLAQYGPGGAVFVQLQPEPPSPGIANYGPEGVLFNTIGPPMLPVASFNPTEGIMFADTTAGDTVAQYGPGGAVFVQLQPEPPSPGIANYGPEGVLFNTVGPPMLPVASFNPTEGIMFADTSAGDTVAKYGPGGAVFVQLQPEPPSPGIANYGPGGILFNMIGPPEFPAASFNPIEGIMFADTSDGDTVGMYTSEQILLKGDGTTAEPFDVRVEPRGMFFEIETSTTPQTEFSGNGVIMSDAYGDTAVQLIPDSKLILRTVSTTDTAIAEYSSDGAGYDIIETTRRAEIDYSSQGASFLLTGYTNLPARTTLKPSGLMFEDDTTYIGFSEYNRSGVVLTSETGGDTTVQISNQGSLSLNLDAGATQIVEIGERYRDNALVAWGRVSGSGTLQSEFGVASVTRNYIGDYTITLDITAAGTEYLIPMAVAEVESAPLSASAARLLTVNQTSASSFDVYITNGNYIASDNDFLFMVTAR